MAVLLRVLVRACAGAMLVAAAMVGFGGYGPLPPLDEVPHLQPVLAYAVLNAVLLLVVAGSHAKGREPDFERRLAVSLNVPLILLGFAVIDAALAWSTIGNADGHWAAAFWAPALAGGLLVVAHFSRLGPRNDDGPPEEEDDPDFQIREAVEDSRRPPEDAVRTHLRTGFIIGLLFAILIGIGPVCTRIHEILHDAVFGGDFPGWQELLGPESRSAIRVLAVTAATTAAFTLIFFLEGLGEAGVRRFREKNFKDFRRELNAEETALIRALFVKLRSFFDSQVRPRGLTTANWLLGLGFVALLFGYLIFFYDANSGLGTPYFEQMRTRGTAWAIYIDRPGAGDFLAGATVALFYWWLSLKFTQALISSAGGYVAPPGDNALRELRESVAVDVRAGRLKEEDGFDPASHFSANQEEIRTGLIGLTIASALLTPVFFFLDRMDYTLFADRGITYTNYWTTKATRVPYSQVSGVTLKCYPGGDDVVQLVYVVHIGTSRTIDALRAQSPAGLRILARRDLAAWERLDAKLRAHGVPFRRAPSEERGFDARFCRDGIFDTLEDKEAARRIWALLQAGQRSSSEARERLNRAMRGPHTNRRYERLIMTVGMEEHVSATTRPIAGRSLRGA